MAKQILSFLCLSSTNKKFIFIRHTIIDLQSAIYAIVTDVTDKNKLF